MTESLDALRAELARAARALGAPEPIDPVVERPRDPAFGDWTTNLAMVLAKPMRRRPRDLAEELIRTMDFRRAGLKSAEIAGPGFINMRVDPGAVGQGLVRLIEAGTDFGRHDAGRGALVNVEFVSANPTGPLHVGHGRQAALGDAIASLLEWSGWKVTREFYYNDAGAQIQNLALSVQARIREAAGQATAIPDGGYHGDYIRDIAQHYVTEHADDPLGDDLECVRDFAVRALRKEQDRDLAAFGVRFDVYYLESSLYAEGKVDETQSALVAAGHTYE